MLPVAVRVVEEVELERVWNRPVTQVGGVVATYCNIGYDDHLFLLCRQSCRIRENSYTNPHLKIF